MRITHVINELRHGGAERQLVGLVERSRFDHEIVELNALGASRRARLRALGTELERRDARIIVAWLERSQIACPLVAPRHARLVAAVRGLPSRNGATRALLFRTALTRYDALVSNSFAGRAATRAFAAPLRLQPFLVIPNGLLSGAASQKSATRPRVVRIGYIGRGLFDPNKGVDVLLDALELVPQGTFEATLIGDAVPEAVELRQLGGSVKALPAMDDPWEALGEVDVLVVPSRSESSPNVVIEAFARCVPVVGTRVGGVCALADGDRAILVPPNDPPAVAAAIARVSSEREQTRERTQRALTYVGRVHNWDRVIAAYDHLFAYLGARA